MIGLLSAPAVMREPGSASTAVRLTVAVGHRFERTSRVTCTDASAVSRATEIWGLFFRASACASFRDSSVGVPGLFRGVEFCDPPIGGIELTVGADCCGMGAEGKVDDASERISPCARQHTGRTSANKIGNTFFIRRKPILAILAVVSLTLEPQSVGRDIRADRRPAQ